MKKILLASVFFIASCQQSNDVAEIQNSQVDFGKSDTATLSEAPQIILPGAPGQTSQTLDAREAIKVANNSYSFDDASFMRNMIPHHSQAIEMSNLVAARTNKEEIIALAGRIKASQADEIKFMQDWLSERNEQLKMDNHSHHHSNHQKMEGMASPEQMQELSDSTGTDFDKLFLSLMISHHEGALTMVKNLTDQPGSAYDPILYDFTSDIRNDQTSEIELMSAILSSFSSDPRATLSAGFLDAEEASMNLELISFSPKPAGFFDPNNPSGIPPVITDDNEEFESRVDDGQSLDGTEWSDRSPLLSFSNTDMAFHKDILVAGNYHGFNIYKLQNDGIPELYSSVVCPGGQGDVSIVGDLLLMSVEQTRGRVDCGLQGISEDVSKDRFRGLRIFDISNLAVPVQVGQVQTCRGSHTHSIVEQDDTRLIVYNSGTSSIRE